MKLPFGHPPGIPIELRGKPNRTATTAVRPWDWALPPRHVEVEVISAVPEGWNEAPRGHRRPPLLFVHGASGAAWTFAEHWLGAAVRRGYPAHAVSLRGHGGSPGRERLRTTTLRDYIDDVLQTIVGLPEPPVLIGHGMGAVVVQLVLERYPARAGVLVGPPPLYGVRSTVWSQLRSRPWEAVGSLVTGRLPVRPDLFFYGLDDETAEGYLRRMGRESHLVTLALTAATHSIGPVYCPMAVVGCHADALIHPTEIRHTADMYGVKPIWLPGAGHLVMLDGSHSVSLDVILDWVDSQLAVGTAIAAPIRVGRR